MPKGYRVERAWYQLRLRLRTLFRGRRVDGELDEEVAYHVDRLTERNLAAGMTAHDARQAALRAFGGVTQRIEECRDARGLNLLHDLLRDVQYGVRIFTRAPSFSTAAILTLALGVGATVAVFSVVNGVLLRPLPFPDGDRLVLVSHARLGPFMPQPSLADYDYLTFRAHDRSLAHVAAYTTYPANVLTASHPARITVGRVTSDFFTVLGIPAAAGRTFLAEDEARSETLVVLGEDFWRSRMGADAAIVGQTITLDGRDRTVIGVMPRGFEFPAGADAWILYTVRLSPGLTMSTPVIGRLKPGMTLTGAREQFASIVPHFKNKGDAQWTSGLLPLKAVIVGNVRRPLEVFSAAVAVVLLIACANVANLLLARGSARQRELAVRAALGASPARLMRQLLTESLLLALCGAALGLALAAWGGPALLALAPEGRIPRLGAVRIDGTAIAVALALSLFTGVLFGLLPAVRLAWPRTSETLTTGLRKPVRDNERLRNMLVVAEIALSLVLLTAGGLLAQSFLRLRSVDPGFHADNVLMLTVDLPDSAYATADRLQRFHADVLERLAALPGVTHAGAVNWRPLGTMLISGDFSVEGAKLPDDVTVDKPAISPGYFQAIGIAIREGRDFAATDAAGRPPVAIVSRSVAHLLDPAGRALGKRITFKSGPKPEDWLTVVGIVDDIRQQGPSQPSHAAIYLPIRQVAQPFFLSHMTFVVRTSGDPMGMAPAVRTAVHSVDRTLPADATVTMDSVLEAASAAVRFNARLLGAFAVIALLLTVIGTYGVLAYSVAQRTQEIGVRMALGAEGGTVRWMVVRRTLILSAFGIALGTAAALATTRLLETLLFAITPTDVPTFSVVAATILVAAVAASYVPARRATRVDPLLALRHE